jgi:hypothetical protein
VPAKPTLSKARSRARLGMRVAGFAIADLAKTHGAWTAYA